MMIRAGKKKKHKRVERREDESNSWLSFFLLSFVCDFPSKTRKIMRGGDIGGSGTNSDHVIIPKRVILS